MGGLEIVRTMFTYTRGVDCMLTACQDHLGRHLTDNVTNDEECREQIIVSSSEVQIFFHAGDVCIRYHMVSISYYTQGHLSIDANYLLTLAQSSSRTKYPIVAQLLLS